MEAKQVTNNEAQSATVPGANSGDKAKDSPAKSVEEEFDFEEAKDYDSVKEKFEIIGIKMDIHKSGVLYLKELVSLFPITC